MLLYFTDNNEFRTRIKFAYLVGVSHCSGSLTGMVEVCEKSLLRDGPLEKLLGGGAGNFPAAGIFFR